MDAKSYELSHMDDIEFFREDPQLEVYCVFEPDFDTLFSQPRLKTWNSEDQ